MANIPCVEDSCSVALNVDTVTGILGAETILSPTGGLECVAPDGLGILLDPDACNPLALSAAGLIAPYEHDSVLLSDPGTTGNGSTGVTVNVAGVSIDVDAFAAAYGTTLTEITTRSSLSYTNNTCRTVNFAAKWLMGPPAFALVNGWWFAIGTRNDIVSPASTGTALPSVFYNTTSSPFAGTGTSLGLAMPPAIYEIESFLLPGETATITVSIFAQAITVGPASTNVFNENTAAIYFGQNAFLYAWTT